MAFLGVKETQDPEEIYCEVCRAARLDDCANCDRRIEVKNDRTA